MNYNVSVIIPVYNRQDVVGECVRSVLAQSYENLEVILVDDGSADRTVEICRELEQQDARVRLLEAGHGGVSRARNVGIEAATGELITFVDSDDVIHYQMIENLVRAITQYDTAIAAVGVAEIWEEKWDKVRVAIVLPAKSAEIERKTNAQALDIAFGGRSPLSTARGVMLRRDLLDQTRFVPELFIGEDFYFIYENLVKGADVAFVKQTWYFARQHQTNSTRNYSYDAFYSRFLRRKLIWEREAVLGRDTYVQRQKKEVLFSLYICLKHQPNGRERGRMRKVMRQHRKELFSAYGTKQKLIYYLSAYLPFDFVPALLETMLGLKRGGKKKIKR